MKITSMRELETMYDEELFDGRKQLVKRLSAEKDPEARKQLEVELCYFEREVEIREKRAEKTFKDLPEYERSHGVA